MTSYLSAKVMQNKIRMGKMVNKGNKELNWIWLFGFVPFNYTTFQNYCFRPTNKYSKNHVNHLKQINDHGNVHKLFCFLIMYDLISVYSKLIFNINIIYIKWLSLDSTNCNGSVGNRYCRKMVLNYNIYYIWQTSNEFH